MSEFSTEAFRSPQELEPERYCRVYFRDDLFPDTLVESDIDDLEIKLRDRGLDVYEHENPRTGITYFVDCPEESAPDLYELLADQGFWVTIPASQSRTELFFVEPPLDI